MNNETKQQMIDFHKSQIENHQAEIEKLTDQEEPAEQKPMFGQAFCLDDCNVCLGVNGDHYALHTKTLGTLNQGGYFISKEAAELEAEKRRLRQLARVRMAESWGDNRPDWSCNKQIKYCICLGYEIQDCSNFETLHFRTVDHAQSFLIEVGEDGIRKILEL